MWYNLKYPTYQGGDHMGFSESVGARIRMYRKLRNLSQKELAAKIYKSKSVLSKYELGQANIDVNTLFAIASTLGVSTSDLLDIPDQVRPAPSSPRFGIFQNDTIYLMVRVSPGGFWRGLISLHEHTGTTYATLYIQLPTYEDVTKCRAVYRGTLLCFPTNAAMLLSNVNDPADITGIFSCTYKGNSYSCFGLFLQFSYMSNAPAITKAVLSSVPLQESEALENILCVTKDDLAGFKRSNVFSVPHYIPENTFITLK